MTTRVTLAKVEERPEEMALHVEFTWDLAFEGSFWESAPVEVADLLTAAILRKFKEELPEAILLGDSPSTL